MTMDNDADFRWHVGPDGHVYADEAGGVLVARVEHGGEELMRCIHDDQPPWAALIAAAPLMWAVLRHAEWGWIDPDLSCCRCPACWGIQVADGGRGHEDDCTLAAALRAAEGRRATAGETLPPGLFPEG
jgi:hypothetical protein